MEALVFRHVRIEQLSTQNILNEWREFTDGSIPSSYTNSFAGTFELVKIIPALPFRLKSVHQGLNNQEKELDNLAIGYLCEPPMNDKQFTK